MKKGLITGVAMNLTRKSAEDDRLCEACVCAKSTKFPKSVATSRPSVTAVTRRSTHRLLNDEGQSESDFGSDSDGSASDEFRNKRRNKPRDLAIARPLSNSISCVCTDMKGSFKVLG